jgi:hypothetical protein
VVEALREADGRRRLALAERASGVIAVTTTYFPRGFSRSSRSMPSSVTFAFVLPYGSSSSSRSPSPLRSR